MAHKALIEILGNAASYLRAARESAGATVEMEGDLKRLAITARTSVDAQVKASLRKDARLRAEIRTYREVAAAARRGSSEQVTAANLAVAAERRLSRSMSVTAAEASRLARAGRHVGAIGTGAHESSHKLRGLATSAALLSGSLFAGGSIAFGIKDVVEASIKAKDQEQQLVVAVKDAGLSYQGQKRSIDAALASQRALGFQQDDSVKNLALEVRGTKSVVTARQALTLADDISRGRHVALSVAANAVARAYGGQTGALRRLVPFIDKGASATDAIKQAQQAYHGSAAKYATSDAGAQDRLSASLHHQEVLIGNELTPTITRLSSHLSTWLNKSRNQARVSHDVHAAVKTVTAVVKGLSAAIHTAIPVVRTVNKALGGTKHTVELLAGTIAAFKAAKLLNSLTGIGNNAGTASGEVNTLRGRLGQLGKIAPIIIDIYIIEHYIKPAFKLGERVSHAVGNALTGDGSKGWASRAVGIPTPGEGGQPSDREKRIFKAAQMPGGKFEKGTRFADEGGGKVLVFSPKGNKLGELDTSTQAGKVAQIFSYYGLKAGQRATDKKTEAELEMKLLAVGYRLRRNYPIAGHKGAPTKPKVKAHDDTSASSTTPDLDQELKDNKLALASAKTRSAKLAALTDERKLLAAKIGQLKTQMKGATGVTKGLLETDLTKAESADTAAYNKIAQLNHQGAAAARAAAAKAKSAARAAAAAHRQSVETTATELQTAATGTTSAGATRRAFGKLISFYRREAHDADLTRLQQAHYAKLAVDAKVKLAHQLAADQKRAAKAITNKQLAALGIGPGSSVSELLQKVKQAATDKQNGVTSSGTIGTPTVRTLKTETDQIAKALKGTYLDTDASRNVLAKVRNVLSGHLGALNAEMRGKIQQLLTGLKGDLSNGVDGFNLTAADKRRRFLDRRFADSYGGQHGGRQHHELVLPRGLRGFGMNMTPAKLAPLQVHFHYEPKITAIANEPIGHALNRGFFKMRVAMGAH